MIANAVTVSYSTATGNDTLYDKVEAFAHDTALMLVGIAKATSRIKPSEVIQSIKSADRITSFEDFLAYAKNFLEDEALQYIRTALNGEADDIVRLKDIANLLEEASESIGKNLSKAELEAGLETLWREGGVGGALAAIERVFSGGINFKDQALLEMHYEKHAQEIAKVLDKTNYSIEQYLKDANYIIKNGTYVPELNGYIRFMKGTKYGFVGLDRATGNITTFHIKDILELIKKAPSLGFER